MKKVVNGREVPLSAGEEAAVRADWAAEDVRQAERRVQPKRVDPIDAVIAELAARGDAVTEHFRALVEKRKA